MPSVTHAPTDFEQYMLELLNRARLDPMGEFDALIRNANSGTAVQENITSTLSFFGVDLASFQSQLQGIDAVAPLAWHDALAQAAETHSNLMIAEDTQSHNLPGEASLGSRIEAEGYENWSRVGENIYAYTEDPVQGHAGFFIDWGYDDEDFNGTARKTDWQSLGDGIQDPPGHRNTILNPDLTEVGIASIAETSSATAVGPFVVTQDFGARWDYEAQLVGVVIEDADADRFYDLGEGLGGITVTASGTAGLFTTTTWASGGYQIELPEGSYAVTFEGGSLSGVLRYTVSMQAENTKLDGFAADAVARLFLTGDGENNVLTGAGTDDWLIGNGGSDQLTGLGGADVLFGDRLEIGADPNVSAQVYRLYQAALDRAPDRAGHLDWVTQIVTGEAVLLDVSAGFVRSAEFQNAYGAQSDVDFVDQLYQNVLGRSADPGGLAGWVDQLDNGASREAVVLGFSNSQEFTNNTLAASTAYTQGGIASIWADDVYRLYQATLDRAPDAAGFGSWMSLLGAGREYLSVVTGFVASTEFQNTYGALSNTGFVERLYLNVLDRAADAAGRADWVGQLNSGTSREEVVRGFAQSQEFTRATTEPLEAFVRGLGTDDTLSGGGGSNDLTGGAYADVFVFDADTDGDNRVTDFEAWDTLHLADFGYASKAEALAQFHQSGAHVQFEDQGVSLTLLNTQLSMLGEDQIALV